LRYALFLGCTAPVRARNYELATRRLLESLDLNTVDLDFICCGYPVEPANEDAATLMAARNLALAEENGTDILTICNACYGNLSKTNYLLKRDESLRESTNSKLKELNLQFNGEVRVRHLIEVLSRDIGLENLEKKVSQPLRGVRIAAYYGCHYLKPSIYMDHNDNPENPATLDKLIEATKAKSVPFEGSRKCCGGALLGIEQDLALAMSREVLEGMKKSKPDAIVTICPFCGIMLDICQGEIEELYDRRYSIPVLYLPQMIGLSIGLDTKDVGLQLNRVSLDKLLAKIGTSSSGVHQ
jgi:heterodisulfide reductase subunit B